ncbi:6923_t:CDS:2 [Ambispora gerdemannii]|uniref:6923_t:CDS:1 n=1 Tax=Ambispora gerdemannii TaxID=144530 RepID=A0A9N8WIN5_9GLOM|nr:6923_t:CDS:2 [Ambispora gerdemannii]
MSVVSKKALVPASPPQSKFNYPLFGDTIKIAKSVCQWSKGLAKQGKVVKAKVRGLDGTFKKQKIYHLSGIEGMQAFYNEQYVMRGNVPTFLDPYLLDGSSTLGNMMNGEEHRNKKEIILTAIHDPDHLKHIFSVLRNVTHSFLQDLRTKSKVYKYTTFHFERLLRDLIVRLITQFLWTHEDDDDFIEKMIKNISNAQQLIVKVRLSAYKKGMTFSKKLRDFSHRRLAEHRSDPEKYNDTMKHLMTVEPPLANDAIVMEIQHLVFSLHRIESAISAALICLLKHKKSDIYSNIMTELEKNQSYINLMREDMRIKTPITLALPNLTNVIKESLRIFPVNPVQFGTSIQEFIIQGYQIPKGRIIVGGLWATGFDRDIYDDPEGFHPNRFEHEISEVETGFEWTPFGCGETHRCAGQSIVISICTFVVARLLSAFELELVDPEQGFVYRKVVPVPSNELPLQVKIRPVEKVGL